MLNRRWEQKSRADRWKAALLTVGLHAALLMGIFYATGGDTPSWMPAVVKEWLGTEKQPASEPAEVLEPQA